jgi:hypothetical protein
MRRTTPAPARRAVTLALVGTLALGLAGCGGSQEPGPGNSPGSSAPTTPESSGPPASPTSPTPPSSTALPTLPRPTTPPTTPSDIYKPITVTGELFRGPGRCVALITDDGHRYALMGGMVGSLPAGERVTVRGMPAPQVPMHCDGIPLRVYTAAP